MSEANQNGWPFDEEVSEAGLDIAAIFGDSESSSETPPPPPAPQPEPAAETATSVEQPVPFQPAAPSAAVETPDVPAVATAGAPKPEAEQAPAADPIAAMFADKKAEDEKAAAQSLFEKAPVFAYGCAKDPITDAAMTFEELRIAKSEDFPELGEGKKVSWSVEYGKVSKPITDPKGKTIQSVKEEIERSKEFLDGLKKSKDKNPDCLVKPRVTAQSKGTASYKGLFTSLENAQSSDKTICILPSADGKVYELRKTEMGEFIAPKNNVVDLEMVRAGFTPALPLIPQSLLQQIISFFRCYMDEWHEFEALAHILWDRETQEFTVHIPRQTVSKAHIDADLTTDGYSEARYLHYADIHSHNSMAAKFSPVDDSDEKATRLYVVVGCLDKFFPDITVRMSCGGTYQELDPGVIFEGLGEVYPAEWRENVDIIGNRANHVRVKRHLVSRFFGEEAL